MFPGTDGYEQHAKELISRYESVPFEHKYRAEIDLVPTSPVRVLDVGAGTGADAAWLASKGHTVVAVEPTRAFRMAGAALHSTVAIEWVDDGLPDIRSVVRRGQRFELILVTAVWMHLDEKDRRRGMPALASLLSPGGLLLLSLRHGPVPEGRRMFEVTAAETIALASACALNPLRSKRATSLLPENRAAGIEWTRLAFRGSEAVGRESGAAYPGPQPDVTAGAVPRG